MNFPTTANEMKCFEFSDSKGPYFYLGFEVYGIFCSVHMKVLRWSHNTVKQGMIDFKHWQNKVLKPKGISRVIASYKNPEDKKMLKFIRLFGFPKPEKVMISTMEI